MEPDARIQVGKVVAFLGENGWTSADFPLQLRLNEGMEADLVQVAGSDPEPHGTLARLAAQRVGGTVLTIAEDPPTDPETVH